ncbi:unnamed protein product [Absidia cylindrospora]
MSFTNSTIPVETNNDIKLNLNQSTIDLLNAAIVSHSQTQLQQPQLDDKENSSASEHPTTISTQGTSKRPIDSTDESDVTPTTVAPKRAGRKPLEKTTASDHSLDPKQKRKAQNRAAQRAFRERKEKHVSELQDRIRELEELTSKTDADLIQENEQLKEKLQKLQEENYALKDAKFTFEFPVSDQQQQQKTDNDTTSAGSSSSPPTLAKTNDIQDETSGGISSSSSSSTEQSPLSLAQEDDYSDTPPTKTPTNFQDPSSSFLSFGSFANPHDFDVLAIPGGEKKNALSNSSAGYDFKELFHGKDDLFTGYRDPSASASAAGAAASMDDFNTDDFLLDNSGLPALFGGSGDLFGFTQQQQDQHAPFLLDQFYMPDEQQPHVRKETVATSLQRAKQDGVRAFEVQEQLKNCPDFNLDALCAELKTKASCCESNYVLSEHDVDAYLACFNQK